ncbi:MAG: glycine cleavage system aminomethyltransferase GcvT [Candidatus Kryptonium sp.]
MKRTPFYEIHLELGAKIAPFAGFEMPIQYDGIIIEHKRVRESVGVFDVSHMGEFKVSGKDALNFLQMLTVNDVSKISPGRAQYTAMCYEDGGIVDDLLVYNLGDSYMVVVNAANVEKDFEWMSKHIQGDVILENISDKVALLAIQGPRSLLTLQKLTDVDLTQIKYYHFVKGKLAGIEMIISRTGYTGELGFELYFDADPELCRKVWNAIMEAGKEFNIGPVGLGARDTLRTEMGYMLYGNDIDQTTNPLEAGLDWIVKFDKGDFIGKEKLLKIKSEGIKRKLVGFISDDKIPPRHGYEIYKNGEKIGYVTSGTFSPILEKGIGMGYVDVKFSSLGEKIIINARSKELTAVIVNLPFVPNRAK